MHSIWAICRNDWRVALNTPLAWLVWASAAAFNAWVFLLQLDAYAFSAKNFAGKDNAPGITDLIALPYLSSAANLLLLIAPLLAMRSLCGERQNGTLALLFASGSSDREIVIGKWMAIWGLLLVYLLLVFAPVLSLYAGSALDAGKIIALAICFAAFAAAMAALSLLASALAQSQAGAAAMAMVAGLLFWLIDAGMRAQGDTSSVLSYLATPTHLVAALRGVVNSADLAYFAIITGVCLALTMRRLLRFREDG